LISAIRWKSFVNLLGYQLRMGDIMGRGSVVSAMSRRKFLSLALAGAGGLGLIGFRLLSVSSRWSQMIPENLKSLTRPECATLAALFEVLMDEQDPSVLKDALIRADELISHFSRFERMELAGALVLVEQALGGLLFRFSGLSVTDRQMALARARESGGVVRDIYIGMKELASLALYAGPSRWDEIGYGGPLVGESPHGDERTRRLQEGFLGEHWAGERSS